MKKIYFFILFSIALVSFAQAQSRMVLIEEATNASCGPCASQNPAFDILLNQNRDIMTAIKYHWYFPGYDPMYNHNTVENNARVAYYGINGVPTATIDGDIPDGPTFSYPGGPHGYTQALLDEYAAHPTPFNVWLSHRITDDQDSIYIDMMIEATAAVSGNFVAQMVVVEKHIHFTSPPGTNGETDFLDVMKKMIPDEEGTPLPTVWQPGDYLILQGAWKLQNIYNYNELGVVGFIQDNNTKDVQQAGNSSTDPLTPLYAREVNLIKVAGVSETNCLGMLEPKITIRNNGSDLLTSTEIFYRVNDETTYTYEWTGNLGFLESETVTLPQVSFELLDQNNFHVYSINPNGSPDEYPKNDTLVQAFDRAAITPLTVKLMLRTDANPGQTTWEILNSAGEVQSSGGPYTNANTVYQETFQLGDMECYIFKIHDSGGDGLVPPGFYALYYGSGTFIKNGSAFGSLDSAYFEVNTQVGIGENGPGNDVSIYPNPAKSSFSLYFFLGNPEKVSISLYDLVGQRIRTESEEMMAAGPQSVKISTDDLKPGIYLVQTTIGGKTRTQKLTVVK